MFISAQNIDSSLFNVITIIATALILKELEKKSIFMLHASAVEKNGNLYVFWGSSGSGKTGLILKLCRDEGFKFVSNGTVLLKDARNKIKCIGTFKDSIKLRSSTVSQLDQELFKMIFLRKNSSFNEKKEIFPNEIKIKVLNEFSKLEKIRLFTVRLSSNNPIFNLQKQIGYRSAMMLYSDLSRHSKMSELYCELNGYNVFLPSIDGYSVHKKRVEFINRLISQSYCGNINGNIENTIKELGLKI